MEVDRWTKIKFIISYLSKPFLFLINENIKKSESSEYFSYKMFYLFFRQILATQACKKKLLKCRTYIKQFKGTVRSFFGFKYICIDSNK